MNIYAAATSDEREKPKEKEDYVFEKIEKSESIVHDISFTLPSFFTNKFLPTHIAKN